MKTKIKLTYLLLLFCSFSFGQMKDYKFKVELFGIQNQWHKILLTNDIFAKTSSDLSDIKIFGITAKNDTIEAPYILQIAAEKEIEKDVTFKLINQSKNNKGYYFTFELPAAESSVNQIQLEFKEQNFDWRINLEGSQNLQEWFSITEDYRILSIKNELTDFQFTKVIFPDSKYRYFRLLVESKKNPELLFAKMFLNKTIDGNLRKFIIHSTKIDEEKKNKQTIINVELNSFVPVSKLKFFVNDTFDYYRPVTIKYLTDSFKTQQGWKFNYSTLTSGTLNSLEKNEFKFNSTSLSKLKIIIENGDNQPLQIDSIFVEGYVHELVTRFIKPATYYLTYGNSKAIKPQYDIGIFADKIPTSLTYLKLGDEQLIDKDTIVKKEPLFQNKAWLWGIIVFIIILLGWFSFNMIRRK